MTWLGSICLKAYGEFTDLTIGLGERLTVVYGTNEAGKSTAHEAVTDFLWGIPTRSQRASLHARPRLALEADVHLGTGTMRCVRSSNDLSQVNGPVVGVEPWNPDGGLDRTWWLTNFGVDHRAMRSGGAAVLKATQGASDIADLIFVARRGELAHSLRTSLNTQLEKVYATDGRRRTELRGALERLDSCKAQLQATLMRAGDVEHQRARFEAADLAVGAADKTLRETQSRLSTARAHARVIDHVLAYVAAETELGDVDAAGPRLEPDDLRRYQEALARQAEAEQTAAAARAGAENLQRQIAGLAVDPDLLSAGDDIDALANELQARLEELDQLVGKHRPDAERHESTIRTLLTKIGVSLTDGVEEALGRALVRSDLSATLDDLAKRIEDAERTRTAHRDQRQAALGRLTDRGVLLDLAVSHPLPETEVTHAEQELRAAQTAVREPERMLERLEQEIAEITAAQDLSSFVGSVSRQEVAQARAVRDGMWDDVRVDWVEGPVRSREERLAVAEQFTGLLRDADAVADREAEDREGVAARRAVAEVHDNRLQSLREQVGVRTEELTAGRARLAAAQEDWRGLWASAGVAPPPRLEQADLILADLTMVHKETGAMRDSDERLRELKGPWAAAAADAGLPESATPAAWHARSALQQQIDRAQTEWDKTRAAISNIERRGEDYRSRALDMLKRCDPSAVPSEPHDIAAGIRALHRRLTTHRAHQARATALESQLEAQHKAEQRATQKALDAKTVIEALRDAHQIDDVTLRHWAARAEQATAPIQRMDDAIAAMRTAWPDRAARDVIRNLRNWDRAAVEAERQEAEDDSNAAEEKVKALSQARGTQKTLLEQAASQEGADEALAQVRAAEATVTELASTWLRLRLQIELLKRAIDLQGDEGALPLLVDAGQILDRLTGGRWVALQPTSGHGPRALRVLRADERAATPEELSEGTLDQVYLALRLAAVRELHRQRTAAGKPAVPLVLDDVLMAFDVDRTREALALLSDLARDLQIIVFTHHAYVADQARELPDVHVTELPAPEPITADRDPQEVRVAAAQPGPAAATADSPPTRAANVRTDLDPSVVRAWAEAKGLMEPGRRGRIPSAIQDRYQREHMLN